MKNIIIFCLTILASCGNSNHNQVATENTTTNAMDSLEILDQTILKVHDEVMPKIGLVLSLRRKINAQLDSINGAEQKQELQKISYALTKADADMMQWMRAYQKPLGADTALSYLYAQLAEINRVGEQILSSIDLAQNALK